MNTKDEKSKTYTKEQMQEVNYDLTYKTTDLMNKMQELCNNWYWDYKNEDGSSITLDQIIKTLDETVPKLKKIRVIIEDLETITKE